MKTIELPATDVRPATRLEFQTVAHGGMIVRASFVCGGDGKSRTVVAALVFEPESEHPMMTIPTPIGISILIEIAEIVRDRKHL